MALMALLTGVYHLSRRRTTDLLSDMVGVQVSLGALSAAAERERENLLPYLVDCCHAYTSVGEMVETLKRHWGEFQEPRRF